LLGNHANNIESTLLYMGIAVMFISVTVAQFIKNPPAGYVPVEPNNLKQKAIKPSIDFAWTEMIKTKRFYLICSLFLFSTTVGMMIIQNAPSIATDLNLPIATALLVSLLALMNGLGRLFGGMLSDKIGRTNTLFLVLVVQMLNMVGFIFYTNLAGIIFGIIFAGLCFGTLMTVFPAMTADQFGLKNYGVNYGIVYLFWGLAGLVAPVIANQVLQTQGNFTNAFIFCAAMMPVLILVNFILKREMGKV